MHLKTSEDLFTQAIVHMHQTKKHWLFCLSDETKKLDERRPIKFFRVKGQRAWSVTVLRCGTELKDKLIKDSQHKHPICLFHLNGKYNEHIRVSQSPAVLRSNRKEWGVVRRGVERREHGRGQRSACPRPVCHQPAGRGPVPLVGGVSMINCPLLDSVTLSATWTITGVEVE